MRLQEILSEAGEPKDSSRRGFLKKAGAFGATAMTDPSSLLKGAGQLASSSTVPLAQLLSNPAALEARLVSASLAWALKNVKDIKMDSMSMSSLDSETWKPNGNDQPVSYSKSDDPNRSGIKSIRGEMPWKSMYFAGQTQSGIPYIYTTASDFEGNVILTYINKNGETKTFEMSKDELDEINKTGNGNTYSERWDDYIGKVIDTRAGLIQSPKDLPTDDLLSTSDTPPPESNILGSLAKRALMTNLGKKLISKFSKKDEPEISAEPEMPKADEPLQLPAPDKSTDDLLSPDLQRMKDLAGIKRKNADKN